MHKFFKRILSKLYLLRLLFGSKFDVKQYIKSSIQDASSRQDIDNDLRLFSDLAMKNDSRRFSIPESEYLYCLHDKTSHTDFDRHYVYHLAWAIRVLDRLSPAIHLDISSSIYFSAIASHVTPFIFCDYRPPLLKLDNVKVVALDLQALPFQDESFHSVSCMHVLEHVGLGRYGDPIDPTGDLKAIEELKRIIAPGGHLMIAVPVGRKRIMYNAHRVYAHGEWLSAFQDMNLVEFSIVCDYNASFDFVTNPPEGFVDTQEYACGCYLFQKFDAGHHG